MFQKTDFMVQKLTKETPRFDFEWLDPVHQKIKKMLLNLSKNKGYKIKTVDSLCDVFCGKTADQYITVGIPIIKLRNVSNEGINWDTDFVLESFYEKTPEAQLKLNDIIVNATGEGMIGRVSIYDKEVKAMAALDVNILRVKDKKELLPLYLLYYLRSIFGQLQFERYTVGSTGQTHLKSVDNVEVAYPTNIEDQKMIIEICWKDMKNAQHYHAAYAKCIENAKSNFVSFVTL